jgi:hypothetical protein
MIDVADKRAAVVKGMREGLSLRDASLAAGYAASSGGFKALVAACRAMPKADVEAYRQQLRAEADQVRIVLLERIAEGAPSRDLSDLVRALSTVWARLARMLGTDAAERTEIKLTTELPEDVAALKERLARLLEGNDASTADHDSGDASGGPAAGPGLVGADEPERGPVGTDSDP